MSWRTYLPHRAERAGFRIYQLVGGRRWSLAIYIKPKV